MAIIGSIDYHQDMLNQQLRQHAELQQFRSMVGCRTLGGVISGGIAEFKPISNPSTETLEPNFVLLLL
jgi:hypothetical protein